MTKQWCGSGGVGGEAADGDRPFPQERGADMTAVSASCTFLLVYIEKSLKTHGYITVI